VLALRGRVVSEGTLASLNTMEDVAVVVGEGVAGRAWIVR
jgi:hypothetical protein